MGPCPTVSQKITFAEMRASGVRGLLVYTSAAATRSRSAVIRGARRDAAFRSRVAVRMLGLWQAWCRRAAGFQLECPGTKRRNGLPIGIRAERAAQVRK
jgi:hypothetical protein